MTPEDGRNVEPLRRTTAGDRWAERDLPVLVEIVDRIDGGSVFVEDFQVATALAMELTVVRQSFAALARTGYIEMASTIDDEYSITGVTARAYLAAGLHPDGNSLIDRLVSLLDQAARQVDDPEEQSRLRALRRNVLDVGGQTLANVLAALVTRGIS